MEPGLTEIPSNFLISVSSGLLCGLFLKATAAAVSYLLHVGDICAKSEVGLSTLLETRELFSSIIKQVISFHICWEGVHVCERARAFEPLFLVFS